MKHICQGPKCHTYETQSRVRGTKGNKVLRTRFARFNLEVNREWIDNWEHYFCDERCMNDWLRKHMTQLINFVGLKTKPQESPIDVIQEIRTAWDNSQYTRTTIKLKQNENNVLT
jgi:N-formylglutamate amidohydrolase